jgi:hypothetical protein
MKQILFKPFLKEEGKHIRWEWEMYGVFDDLYVIEREQNKLIRIVYVILNYIE